MDKIEQKIYEVIKHDDIEEFDKFFYNNPYIIKTFMPLGIHIAIDSNSTKITLHILKKYKHDISYFTINKALGNALCYNNKYVVGVILYNCSDKITTDSMKGFIYHYRYLEVTKLLRFYYILRMNNVSIDNYKNTCKNIFIVA